MAHFPQGPFLALCHKCNQNVYVLSPEGKAYKVWEDHDRAKHSRCLNSGTVWDPSHSQFGWTHVTGGRSLK